MTTNNKLENAFGTIEESKFKTKAGAWKEDLHWMEYSQQIALEVLEILDQRNITQKAFAEQLEVSPQAVNKWLRGKENFTIETISKIERALGIRLLTIGNQPAENQFITSSLFYMKENYRADKPQTIWNKEMRSAKVFHMSSNYTSTAN